MDDATLRPHSEQAVPALPARDPFESVLVGIQVLIAAYAVVGTQLLPSPNAASVYRFSSGPALGRLALAWRDHGMIWAQAVTTAAALLVAGRFVRPSYAAYVELASVHFCLTVAVFAVLAEGTTFVSTGPGGLSIDRVRIDHDWPVVVLPWFLFCNPVLILLAVRTGLRAGARVRTARGAQ